MFHSYSPYGRFKIYSEHTSLYMELWWSFSQLAHLHSQYNCTRREEVWTSADGDSSHLGDTFVMLFPLAIQVMIRYCNVNLIITSANAAALQRWGRQVGWHRFWQQEHSSFPSMVMPCWVRSHSHSCFSMGSHWGQLPTAACRMHVGTDNRVQPSGLGPAGQKPQKYKWERG
jgi:hypothetical protein